MEIIQICFICDENYVIPTTVAIYSIKKNQASGTHLHIHILADNISTKSTKLLQSLSFERCQISVFAIDNSSVRDLNRGEDFYVSTAALIKFRLASIFEDIDKILYLDGDIIVQEDLSKLWNYNLSNVYAGVIKNIKPYNNENYQTEVLRTHHTAYFNSGVMLLNLDRIRKHTLEGKLLYYRKHGINNNMDQDALNVVFKEEVLYLPLKYNVQNGSLCKSPIKEVLEYYDLSGNYTKDDIIRTAAILHLAAPWKPWLFSNVLYSPQWNSLYKEIFHHDCPNRLLFSTSQKRTIFQQMPFKLSTKDIVVEKEIHLYIPIAEGETLSHIINLTQQQSLIPDRLIFLYTTQHGLSTETFLTNGIPVEIRPCKNAPLDETIVHLSAEPNVIRIFTPPSLLKDALYIETLFQSHISFPNSICSTSSCLIRMNNQGKATSSDNWNYNPISEIPSFALVALDNGGILFPPCYAIRPDIRQGVCDPIVLLHTTAISNNISTVKIDVDEVEPISFDKNRLRNLINYLRSISPTTTGIPPIAKIFLSSNHTSAYQWQQDELSRKYAELESLRKSKPFKIAHRLSQALKKIKYAIHL
jgi:lipopolysaccharide biosynthesis glycosyltransferase